MFLKYKTELPLISYRWRSTSLQHEKRGKTTWRLVYSMGFDTNGNRIRRTKTVKAPNKKEAKKLLAQFITEIEAGEYIAPEKMKFIHFVEEWRTKYAENHLSPNTLTMFQVHLKNRIIPYFGEMNLDQIKALHILNFLKIQSSYIEEYF